MHKVGDLSGGLGDRVVQGSESDISQRRTVPDDLIPRDVVPQGHGLPAAGMWHRRARGPVPPIPRRPPGLTCDAPESRQATSSPSERTPPTLGAEYQLAETTTR